MRPKNLTGGTDDPSFDLFRFEDSLGYTTTYPGPDTSNPLAVTSFDSMYVGTPPTYGGSVAEDYVLLGGKWGSSSTLGTPGGTVTWSIAGAGLSNASGDAGWFTGSTVDLSAFLGFDYLAVLTQAFAAWSAVANITFSMVTDGGGNMGAGSTAMIRIGGGYIDGASGYNTLATAWSPGSGTASSSPLSGDIIFDSAQGSFWTASSFLAVATHEIGHSLGLNHTSVTNSLMNPTYNSAITTPQADDIAGIRAIYGSPVTTPPAADDYRDSLTDTTAPFGQVSVNGTRTGTLETAADQDWIQVNLVAGTSYIFTLQGTSSGNGTLSDPYLRLYNSAGTQLLENDDAGPVGSTTDSRLRYTATSTGVYYLSARAFQDNLTGTYTVSVSNRRTAPSDFGGDGISDLLWINNSTGLVGLWNPDGGTGFTYQVFGQGDPNWQLQDTGDFNNDTRADLVWRNTATGIVGLWSSNGSGGFTYQVYDPGDRNWQIQGVADLNGDGRSDIIWSNPVSGQLGFWYGSNSGTFTYQTIGQSDRNWQIAGTGDFNNDGRADIVWRNTATSQSGLWYATAGGGFSANVFGQTTDASWQIQGTGDFNGDSRADILWRNLSSGQVGFWTNDGAGGFSYRTIDVPDQNWQIRGTGDYNGDGRTDLFWGNSATGQVRTWFTAASGGFVSQTINQGDPAWNTVQGNDLLVASTTTPILFGNPGVTTFAIRPGSGVDSIYNFETSQDVLQFSSSLFANYAAAMSHASQVGANTVFSIDANNSLTLANIDRNTLAATNFRFA